MKIDADNFVAKYHKFVIFLICNFLFFFSTSYKILNPEYIDYLSPGDMETHWLGWLYFRHTPFLQFPLLSNFSYGLENWSATIIHTDSLPIMALIFRPFTSYLPQLFQYFGFWIYLCFLFQGFSSFYLLNYFLKDKTKSVVSTIFFLIAPIFLWRLWGHYALLAQGLLLISFYLFFSDYKKLTYWLILLLVSSLINAYFSGMILLLFLCNLIKKNNSLKEITIKFFKILLSLLFFMWILGFFQLGTSFMAGGYGLYRMNINSLINPVDESWSTILPLLPSADYDHDGFAFLGIGILILLVFSIFLIVKNQNKFIFTKEIIIVLSLCLFCYIFALSDNITLGKEIIFSYETPTFLKIFTKTFRSSARFIWIPFYMIMIFVIWMLHTNVSRRNFLIILFCLATIQIYDTRNAFTNFHKKHDRPTEFWKGTVVNEKGLVRTRSLLDNQPWKNEIWDKVVTKYKKFYYVIPKNRPGDYFEIAFLAVRNNIQINFGYFSRYSKTNEKKEKMRLTKEIKNGIFDREAAYFFWDEELYEIAKTTKKEGDLVYDIDGYKILLPAFNE